MKRWETVIKTATVLTLFVGSYWILYVSLTLNLSVSPIEIKNECEEEENSFVCERKFDVPTYFEDIKKRLGEVPKNKSIVDKLAGVSPDLFTYSVGFVDKSWERAWIGQNTIPMTFERGSCPFPENFSRNAEGGMFKEVFPLSEIPSKLQLLATALNDCSQPIRVLEQDIDSRERGERYEIFIKPTWQDYFTLAVLSFLVSSILIGSYQVLQKFVFPKRD